MAIKVAVGYWYTEKDGEMVGITINGVSMGIGVDLARELAIDLLIQADRIDPPKDKESS